MAIKERMSGNEAVSYAIRQVNPEDRKSVV